MSSSKRSDSEPFQEPLSPLPAGAGEEAESLLKPAATEARIPFTEPERILPAEGPEGAAERGDLQPARVEVEVGLAISDGELRGHPRWKFWKRPSKRDRQLETLRQGATEMVGLMRSIRDHLEAERGDRAGLRRTLSPLPVAVESLKSMSEHQANAGRVLGELCTTIEQRAEKDGLVLDSLNRIGNSMSNVEETFGSMGRTLSGMDRSNQQAAKTMELLGERLSHSDKFMNETFARLREAEREFADHVTRNSRRSGFAMAAVCSILLLSVVAVGFMFKENRELLSAVQRSGSLVVQVPMPKEREEAVTLFEMLNQVDDGIGEPDREIVSAPPTESVPVEEALPVETTEEVADALLSVNKLPRRK